MPNDEINRKSNLRQAQQAARNEAELSPEGQKAEQYRQGAPMEGVGEMAGPTGGVSNDKNQSRSRAGQIGGNAAQATGTAMKTAGTGVEAGGKALKWGGRAAQAVGGAAGAGIGAAAGAIGGAIAGSVIPGAGTLAGLKAGAQTGAKYGKKAGQLPGQALTKAGQAAEKAGKGAKKVGDRSKQFGRNLKKLTGPKKDEDTQLKISAKTLTTRATSSILRQSWLNLIDTFFLTWFYIAFHFISTYFTPWSNFFCKFGEEWMPTMGSGASKELTKRASKPLEILEIFGCVFIGLLILGVILLIITILGTLGWAATNKLEAAELLFGGFWGALWHGVLYILGVD